MPRSIPAFVNPALLIWARERVGLSLDGAAERAGFEAERLRRWEQGEERPSIPQLRTLGDVYKRPLAVFFLSAPPTDFDPQREFRRLPGVTPQSETPELRMALRAALFRREVARDLYERMQEPIPEMAAAVHPNENEEVVGDRIRTLLTISWDAQVEWPSAYAALDAWRTAVERVGVLVFQTGDVDKSEMRGTSIPHGPLPVILLNSNDAPHGRLFTLVHELVHILLTNGGHRTSPMEGQRLPEDQLLERVSNRFAAATLMPRAEFLAEAARHPDALAGDDAGLRRFANRVKVSPEAILRRLISLHRVPASLYREKRRDWQQRLWYSPRTSQGGPPIEVRVVSSVGRPFASLVVEAYQRNAVSSADVVDFLGVQLKHLGRIAGQLLPGPGSAAFA